VVLSSWEFRDSERLRQRRVEENHPVFPLKTRESTPP
jgi:hypothetical protein